MLMMPNALRGRERGVRRREREQRRESTDTVEAPKPMKTAPKVALRSMSLAMLEEAIAPGGGGKAGKEKGQGREGQRT